MKKISKSIRFSLFIALLLLMVSTAKAQNSQMSHIPDSYGFVVEGVSGNPVMLDRTWYQEAKSDGNGGWTKSIRTMSGSELTTTVITYKKKPTDKNRFTAATMIITFVQSLTNDNIKVPIVWVDEEGNPTAAPTGLEKIKEANGATGVVTYATLTPLTGMTAFGLNYVKFAGLKGWKNRETRNILPFFESMGKLKGCVVVDDRTSTGSVYDGISTNPKEYPTTISTIPHTGLLNGIKFK